MKKNPELTDKTRSEFIDAFCILYEKKPIEKITVKELAEKAGYNRCTFYHYFTDAYQLLTYMEDQLIDHIRGAITDNMHRDDYTSDYIPFFIRIINTNNKYMDVLLGNPNNTRFAYRLKQAMIPVLISELHLNPTDDTVKYTLEFIIPAIISTISYWIQNGRSISVEQLGELIQGIVNEGCMKSLILSSKDTVS